MNKLFIYVGSLLLVMLSPVLSADPLTHIHKKIEHQYKKVEHINAKAYALLKPSDTVIFDVREQDEYAVSRLDKAVRVDPSISSDDFFAQFADEIKGKKVVFYCSVGRRSSDLVQRLEEKDGSFDLVNLTGGIFQWTNENRPVEGKGVHPYNWFWGRLIHDKSKIFYSPVEDADLNHQ